MATSLGRRHSAAGKGRSRETQAPPASALSNGERVPSQPSLPEDIDPWRESLSDAIDRQLLPNPRQPSQCPLFCCFYAEFDNVVGPKVCFQSPQNFMHRDICISTEQVHEHLANEFERIRPGSMSANQVNQNGSTTKDLSDETEVDTEERMEIDTKPEPCETEDSVIRNSASLPFTHQESVLSQASGYAASSSLSIFESTCEYIITGSELADQIICLSTHNMHILSKPTIINDTGYERNALLFSVGFVLRRSEDPRPFRPLLSKLSSTLRSMEIESKFMSHSQTRPKLERILEGILVSLNSPRAECNLLLNDANALNLKLFKPPKPLATPVPDYVVPVLLRPEWQLQMYDWDLTINWVVPHINGLKYARLISQSSEVDMEMVRACLRVLKHHGVLAFVDVFRYSNRYECTSLAAAMLAGNAPKLLNAAFQFVSKNANREMPSNSTSSNVLDASTNSIKDLLGHEGSKVEVDDREGQVSSSAQDRSFMLPPQIASSAVSYPPRTNALAGMKIESGVGDRKLSSAGHDMTASLRREHRTMKAALAQLYCSCNRNVSFGDILLSKATESSPSLLKEREKASANLGAVGDGGTDGMPSTSQKNGSSPAFIHIDSGACSSVHKGKRPSGYNPSNTPVQQGERLSPLKYQYSDPVGPMRNIMGGGSYEKVPVMNLDQKQSERKKSVLAGINWKDAFDYFDHRRFVTFGVIYGLIRRAHEYPLAYDMKIVDGTSAPSQEQSVSDPDVSSIAHNEEVSTDSTTEIAHKTPSPLTPHQKSHSSSRGGKEEVRTPSRREQNAESVKNFASQVAASMDGTRCDDELACMYQRSLPDLVDLVKKHAGKGVVSLFSTSSGHP